MKNHSLSLSLFFGGFLSLLATADTPAPPADADSLKRVPPAMPAAHAPDKTRPAFRVREWLREEARATGAPPAIEALDRILAAARAEIQPGDRGDPAEARRILSAIDALLTREGFVYQSSKGAGDDVLVSSALRPADLPAKDREAVLAFDAEAFARVADQRPLEWRLGRPEPTPPQLARLRASPDAPMYFADCDRLSALYLALGEALELPLRFVPAVSHAFVRWDFSDGTHLNWETTNGQEMPDAYYRRMPGFNAAAEERGTYLRSLTNAETLGYWLAMRAQVFQNCGHSAEALADLEQSVELYPLNPVAWNRLGLLRQNLGNAEGALKAFAAALEADPDQSQVLVNRASLLQDLGRPDEALAEANRALRLNPRSDRALVLRGHLALAAGQPASALREFSRALSLHPDNVAALTNRAMVLNQLGEPARAEADATRAIALDPRNPAPLGNRAVARLHLGRLKEALADLDSAIDLNPREKLLFANRGALRARARDFRGAEADYSRVLELDSGFTSAYKNRGIARLQLGDKPGALADFTDLRRIAPNTEGLDELLNAAKTPATE